jgi:hypothetical protein
MTKNKAIGGWVSGKQAVLKVKFKEKFKSNICMHNEE